MPLLNLTNRVEEAGDLVESFCARHACEFGVHARPLFVLSCGRGGKVRLRIADAGDKLEPNLRVRLLVDRRLVEDIGNLDVAVLPCLRRIKEILRMRLRLAGKRRPKILLRL